MGDEKALKKLRKAIEKIGELQQNITTLHESMLENAKTLVDLTDDLQYIEDQCRQSIELQADGSTSEKVLT